MRAVTHGPTAESVLVDADREISRIPLLLSSTSMTAKQKRLVPVINSARTLKPKQTGYEADEGKRVKMQLHN